MRSLRETMESFCKRPAGEWEGTESRGELGFELTEHSVSDLDIRILRKHLERTTPFSVLLQEFGKTLEPLQLSTEVQKDPREDIKCPSDYTIPAETESAAETEEEVQKMDQPLTWVQMETNALRAKFACLPVTHSRPPLRSPSEAKVLMLTRWVKMKQARSPRVANVNQVYQFRSCLKRGKYCTVNRYYSTELKREVAIKSISKLKLTIEQLLKFLPRETKACLRVVHPNIVSYIEVFETEVKQYIVMEWCEKGSLTKYIRERGKLDSVLYRKFLAQLASAVNYCFQVDILHRKISSDNIMVTRRNNIKLGDFSFAKEVKKEDAYETLCGVLAFTAPEILECQPYDPYLSEVWSIGVVTYCMVYGVLPFDPTYYGKLLKQMKEPIVFKRYPDTPYPCIHLMHNMIAPANRRYTLSMVMSEPWLQEERPLVETPEKWPPATVEPWREVKENIEALKKKLDHQILKSISEYTTDLFSDKLQRMNKKKRKHESVPERLEWLNKLYGD